MKCPQCGNELTLDTHRKYPINMCYNCGYMEGRPVTPSVAGVSNYRHLENLNFNETAAFISKGLGVDIDRVKGWLEGIYKE